MEPQKRFIEISDSPVYDIAGVIRLLARKYPDELAQVCARPYGETTEEWVEMMADGRCPGIAAGYAPAFLCQPKGAEQK